MSSPPASGVIVLRMCSEDRSKVPIERAYHDEGLRVQFALPRSGENAGPYLLNARNISLK
jgi:hypothetical protein